MRSLKIQFGKSYGSVEVQLGRTRVYTAITSEIVEPKPERPNEGFYLFNTDISPMSNVTIDPNRPNPLEGEISRIIEKGLKESKAIDTESLCIVSGYKVWSIKINIHVLDDCGNLLDCSSISVITALLHFRKPDITVIGNEATIHSLEDREPVPLSIHHSPISITFGFFPDGVMVVDPEKREEAVMDGKLSLLVNIHKEICGVSKGGGTSTTVDQVIKCSKIAVIKSAEIIQQIREALHQEISSKNTSGSSFKRRVNLEMVEHSVPVKNENSNNNYTVIKNENKTSNDKVMTDLNNRIDKKDKEFNGSENGENIWSTKKEVKVEKEDVKMEIESKPTETNTNQQNIESITTSTTKSKKIVKKKPVESDSDSEEEETVILTSNTTTKPLQKEEPKKLPTTTTQPSTTAMEEDSEDLSVALKKKPAKKAAAKKK
eukprot:gene2139-2637_t